MAQIGEGVGPGAVKEPEPNYLLASIVKIKFESGIDIYEVLSGKTERKLPPNGIHWGDPTVYPAVYVRQGGAGETKDVKITVKWRQMGCDGSAELKGVSSDGKIVIEGSFNISGKEGEEEVSCQFTKKPSVVANYGRGETFHWGVEAGGGSSTAGGGSPLKLFFVDQKPKPIGWRYKNHYLQVVDWATAWAEGKAGEPAVFSALWDKFSDGTKARVPHVTTYSYWKTSKCMQALDQLLDPQEEPGKLGWSCRAIAHTYMACLALHGIKCREIVPDGGGKVFLVQNWEKAPQPVPNWPKIPDIYYGGSWVEIPKPPLHKAAKTSLNRQVRTIGPVTPAGEPPTAESNLPLKVDLKKRPGVPAQGQPNAPLGFSNHWIVETQGQLYDTSYGGAPHPNDINSYRDKSVGGWHVASLKDSYKGGFLWLTTKTSYAWQCREVGMHAMIRQHGASN